METEVLSRQTSRPSSATSQQTKLPPIAGSPAAATSSAAAAGGATAPTVDASGAAAGAAEPGAASTDPPLPPPSTPSPLPWITASEPQSPTTSAARSIAAAATSAALKQTKDSVCPDDDPDPDPNVHRADQPSGVAAASEQGAAGDAPPTSEAPAEDRVAEPAQELVPHPPASAPTGSHLNMARARGWPHFVPRMELEVSLKEFREALQQLSGRIARQENRHVELQERFDAWALRADEDLATKNSVKALAGKLTIEVNACRRDFEEELLEIRSLAALDEDLKKANEAHRCLDEAFKEASKLHQDAIEKNERSILALDTASKATYATQEALAEHVSESGAVHEALQQNLQALEEAIRVHDDRHQSHETEQKELRQKLADQALAMKVTDTCLDSVKHEVSTVSTHCEQDLARLEQLKEVAEKLSRTDEAVDKSAADIKQLFEELEKERDLVRETHNNHSKNIREMHKLMDDCYEASKTKGDLSKRCEVLEQAMVAEQQYKDTSTEEFKQAMLALSLNHTDLQSAQQQQRDEIMEILERLAQANESTRQYSTQFCLQQLDEALHLSKNISTVEEKHELLAQKVVG